MSETNGYATFDELERDYSKLRLTDVVVCGKKFQLKNWNAEDAQRFISESEKHPRTVNQRAIIGIVENPKMTREHIERLSKLDAAFVAKLAHECMKHVGINSIDDEEVEKN